MAEEASETLNPPSPSKPSEADDLKQQPQASVFSGFPAYPNADLQMFPIMYPTLVPGFIPSQNQEQNNHGGGIYAVPVIPFMGSMVGLPSNTLIPLKYTVPTRPSPAEGGVVGEERGPEERQRHPPQRQVIVRRFQFGFQLDLLLILKLAAVVFVFNQDGSRQRLMFLLFFASFIYLYQTGALTPFIRWLSRGMQRPGVPPQPQTQPQPQPHPPVRAEDGPVVRPEDENAHQPGNENQPQDNMNQPAENENRPEPARGNGVNWWVIAKEIQMIVVGFVTSLLPGFHND